MSSEFFISPSHAKDIYSTDLKETVEKSAFVCLYALVYRKQLTRTIKGNAIFHTIQTSTPRKSKEIANVVHGWLTTRYGNASFYKDSYTNGDCLTIILKKNNTYHYFISTPGKTPEKYTQTNKMHLLNIRISDSIGNNVTLEIKSQI
jgi:hypothetical protein